MNRAELIALLQLLELFDDTVANDEPAHLACIVIAMHCNRTLEKMTG